MSHPHHGGNPSRAAREYGVSKEALTDFSAGLNPLGFPPCVRGIIDRELSSAAAYPEPEYQAFREAAASRFNISPGMVIPGSGSSQLLFALLRALMPPRVIIAVPCYTDYQRYSRHLELELTHVPLRAENDFLTESHALAAALEAAPRGSMAILGNPNNPSGRLLPEGLIQHLSSQFPDKYICIDEAYIGFTLQGGAEPPAEAANILRLRSLTKLFALPGIRMGYVIAAEDIIERVWNELPSWHVGALEIRLMETLISDIEHGSRTREWLQRAMPRFFDELSSFSALKPYPSDANFVLFKVQHREPGSFYKNLIQRGILLRSCEDFSGLEPGFFRAAIRQDEDNQKLVAALCAELGTPVPRKSTKRPRPALMFQGTSSSAGKSLITMAMCRILAKRGISVAPFKAQNMSLNSFVTPDGGEIGRAQALQAAAARIPPSVLMNPVLLKPTGERRSQVILLGKPDSSLSARAYYQRKTELKTAVQTAYNQLAAQHQAIVLEGAGSPGEVNLRPHDIVNMEMARHADAPVILVGDIDRGGLYASFIGHLAVMSEWERNRVKGFIVNKFRGDPSLLEEAHRYLLERTGKPVIGVIPWIENHGLPDEDGADYNLRWGSSPSPSDSPEIVIGVVSLQRLSNSTDIDPFRNQPGVRLVKIDTVESLRRCRPHAVIIPGSKNVISDLRRLRRLGLEQALIEAAQSNQIILVGICGGFQMLGRSISDPQGIEAEPGARIDGMGLLNLHTTLEAEKTLTQRQTSLLANSSPVSGYEIHHGLSRYTEQELFSHPGLGCRRANIQGTYLHGIFDNMGIRCQFLNELCQRSGLPVPAPSPSLPTLDASINRFTAIFQSHVDVEFLLNLMGLSSPLCG
ncbi:MAG: cobyric acid synthase CobQ [Spirochaeta sp. LUC14_002_19_P3]|nr:MAG: cobyric acid synthase CobQ [Spirochaeta sp. LUC14_002_19_P3]